MSVFRSFLEEEYNKDPVGSARFLSDSCVLVRLRRLYWKGLKKMQRVKVMSDGSEVNEEATTCPSWKLCPKVMRAEFEALGAEVELYLRRFVINPKMTRNPTDDDEDDYGPSLVGNGTYAVDAAVWPSLYEKLKVAQEKWSTAADRWCSEDGYQRMKDELKTQLGEVEYTRVKELFPQLKTMRCKFSLRVQRAPVRIVEDTRGDKELEAARKDDSVAMADYAVRNPREVAAAGWEAFAAQLINPDGTPLIPPIRVGKDGNPRQDLRKVSGRSVAAGGNVARNLLVKCPRYIDSELRGVTERLIAELPEEAGTASAVAKILNSKDEEAVRIGKMLLAASDIARSESKMCEAFRAARRG